MSYQKIFLVIVGFFIYSGVSSTNTSPSSDTHDKVPKPSDSLSVHLSANFQSRHIWRGNLTCSAWNVQPSLSVSQKNFLFGLWGAYTVDNSYSEVNLYASYSIANFTFTVYDYYCPNETLKFNRLFDFNRHSTQHTVDATLTYGGTERMPFWVMASTLIWGDDNDNVTGNKFYSTYIEAGYTWQYRKAWEFEFLLGGTPFEGYYAPRANLVNVGFGAKQTLSISSGFRLPIFVKLVANPYEENLYLVFGATIGN